MAVHAFTLRGPVWRSDAWLIREFRPRCQRDELPPILATVQLDLFATPRTNKEG